MIRVAGLAMIAFGLLGLGLSLVDWKTFGAFRAEDGTARNVADVDEEPDDQQAIAGARTDTATAEAHQASLPSKTADTNGVSASNPANVKVFEREDQGEQSPPTLWADISAGSDVVDEDSGHANFLVTLSEPAERSVVIIFSTVDLSAVDQEDYRSQRGTVTFEPGVVSAEIRTPLVDDDIKEDDEQFAIVLNGAPGIVSFKSRRVTTTIRDND